MCLLFLLTNQRHFLAHPIETEELVVRLAVMQEERAESRLTLKVGVCAAGGHLAEQTREVGEHAVSEPCAQVRLSACLLQIARYKSQVPFRDHRTITAASEDSRLNLRLTEESSVLKV